MSPREQTVATDDPVGGGKPRTTTKATRTRARILDAAAKALSERGYSGMRLSDVAEAAELQTPAIYYHFASREELVEEVMWVGLADMCENLASVLAALPATTSSVERILASVEAHLRHELLISDYTTAAIRNAGQVPPELRVRAQKEENRYGRMWRDLVDAAVRDGVVRPELEPYVARMLVVGALNWTAEWWSPRRASIDLVVENAKDLVRHGLFVPGAV